MTTPSLPVPDQTNIAVQNNTTGAVDYLQFTGTTLTASNMVNYGIAGFNIVAEGDFDIGANQGAITDLVAQNAQGQLDFLGINPQGQLVASVFDPNPVPTVVGSGFFGTDRSGQVGEELVGQIAAGSSTGFGGALDMMGFNSSGQIVASDLIANTVGAPPVVGVADAQSANADQDAFNRLGSTTNENVITQVPAGQFGGLDLLGFSGSFTDGSLSLSASDFGSAFTAPVQSVNPNGDIDGEQHNIGENGNSLEGVQMITQLATGQFDALYADSGYGGSNHEGNTYASELLNLSLPGWHAIDAGFVTNVLFPQS